MSTVLHAFKWSILGEAASRLLAPAIFLVLARLLTPEDFGVVAAATVVISLCQALADAGLGKALVQRRESLDAGATAAFWLCLFTSFVLMGALLIFAPSIAGFFNDSRITNVVRVLALQVPLAGISAIPVALLHREYGFRELFWVRLVTAGLPAFAAIPMALMGFGYWAIVAGTLSGQVLQCATLWARCSWRPQRRLESAAVRQLLRFGRWTAFSAALTWAYGWLDALVVARYLGSHDMGLYRIGNTFVTMVFGLAFAPVLPVLYSYLSRHGHDNRLVGETLLMSARTIALLSLPMAALIVMLGPQIEQQLFGPAWHGLAPLLVLLAIGHGIAWLVGVNGEAYRAIGRPDLETWVMGISILMYLAGYLVAIRYGLLAFVAARVALVILGLALHLLVASRLFGTGLATWLIALARPVAFASIAIAAGLAIGPAGSIQATVLATAVFVAIYLTLITVFERPHLIRIQRLANGS